MARKTGLIGTAALLAYAFTFMTFGVGMAPVYFGLLSLSIGLVAVATFGTLGRMGLGLGCLAVMTSLPVTFISLETFSGDFFLAHAYTAGGAWLVFLGLCWVRRLPLPAVVSRAS